MLDYLIVGSGLFGSVFAREMKNANKNVRVIEKRTHIGGNCFSVKERHIERHAYGPHIFHTSSRRIFTYIQQYGPFNAYRHKGLANYKHKLYSLPVNMHTMYQIYGTRSPLAARELIKSKALKIDNPQNLEEWALSQVGPDIYYKLIYGYTKKQWGKDPKDLPKSIIQRLPIRYTFDDNYFNDEFQGIPKDGYTSLFNNMLDGIPVELGVDYLKHRDYFDGIAKKVVYTGPIDDFFNKIHGELEWRSLRFEHTNYPINDYQGASIINYTHPDIPYTRIVEHKHFAGHDDINYTSITKEYPQKWDSSQEKFYPINDAKNNDLYQKYRALIDTSKYIFGGRLAEYKYYDMDQVIGSALNAAQKEK